ncbi:hypothetical protein [Prosthecobacter fluviatilis]|uniref:Uncharacterized protein n=1 Tax=Prosthecobacter fluviatilis TaxID=445931 RepID=A0ABW0KL42_9BACT
MNSFFRACVLILSTTLSLHAADVPMKTVGIDEFFAGQLQPLPLKLDVPKEYVHANGLELEDSYTYWMLPKEIKPAAESGDLPKTGYVWGKISLNVGWLADQKKFSHEDGLKAELAAAGLEMVAQKKRTVGGHAVIASTLNQKLEDGSRRLLYSAYIATNIETNCIYLSYSPPSDFSKEQAAKVWDAIIDSISKT